MDEDRLRQYETSDEDEDDGIRERNKTSRTGATPINTARAGPSKAVTGSGTDSVIHNTMTAAKDRAQPCACGVRRRKRNEQNIRNSAGARK